MATGVQVYTSADASAPQLYGAAGKLTDILDAVLVNGYGSRTAAGTGAGGAWSITYTATNKRVYRPSAGNRLYLRVNDAAAGTGGAQEALVKGAESFSDVDTATNPMPAVAQSALTQNSLIVRKSATADSTNARPWIILADDRSVMMFAQTGDTANSYTGWMWGDFYSYQSGDSYRTCIIGRITENTGASSADRLYTLTGAAGSFAAITGHFVQRKYDGTGTSLGFCKSLAPGEVCLSSSIGVANGGTYITYPNPEDSGLYVLPLFIHEATPTLRGRIRGLWCGMHNTTAFNDGDTFSGTGDLAGKTFRIIKFNAAGAGYYVVETSDTWDTSS